jgi:hypothetical protein
MPVQRSKKQASAKPRIHARFFAAALEKRRHLASLWRSFVSRAEDSMGDANDSTVGQGCLTPSLFLGSSFLVLAVSIHNCFDVHEPQRRIASFGMSLDALCRRTGDKPSNHDGPDLGSFELVIVAVVPVEPYLYDKPRGLPHFRHISPADRRDVSCAHDACPEWTTAAQRQLTQQIVR